MFAKNTYFFVKMKKYVLKSFLFNTLTEFQIEKLASNSINIQKIYESKTVKIIIIFPYQLYENLVPAPVKYFADVLIFRGIKPKSDVGNTCCLLSRTVFWPGDLHDEPAGESAGPAAQAHPGDRREALRDRGQPWAESWLIDLGMLAHFSYRFLFYGLNDEKEVCFCRWSSK